MKLGSGAFTNLRKAARNLRTRARRVRCRSRVIVQGILRLVRGIARRASRTCLAAGTAVLTPSGPQPIETLRIGDRVTTPAGAGTPGLEIGDDHRVVHLLIEHAEHGEIYATLLRRTAWLRRHHLVDGEAVPLSADDVRFQGPTRLLGTEPAPRGVEGDGRLVTGTYALVRSDVRRLITTSAAGDSAIMTTTDHPFWSEDEQDFVNAGDLRRGERVGSRDGPREVTGFGWAWGAHRVHDIEVDTDHVFYAGPGELLVHNVGKKICGSDGASKAAVDLRSSRTPLRELDIDRYGSFNTKARRGDGLTGHEVLQNAWLKQHGLAKGHGRGAASRNNPAPLCANVAETVTLRRLV